LLAGGIAVAVLHISDRESWSLRIHIDFASTDRRVGPLLLADCALPGEKFQLLISVLINRKLEESTLNV
jgi:hypothetical protein